jgi:hypothetical protein
METKSRKSCLHLNMPLFQTTLNQVHRVLRSPNRVARPVPIRRGAIDLILLVCVEMNDGGGFNVGHRELMSHYEWRGRREEKGGESETILEADALFYLTGTSPRVDFDEKGPRHYLNWRAVKFYCTVFQYDHVLIVARDEQSRHR